MTLTIDLKIQLELIQNINFKYKNYVYSREAEPFFSGFDRNLMSSLKCLESKLKKNVFAWLAYELIIQ